ncbi:MAG: MBL fold metallo-hydrolase [Deltaproteobacteria bacterium]|nr:MBL fold metallo-hydrolase [Deltaproteobacteria bacterium]
MVGSSDAFNAAGRGHSCFLLEGDGIGPLMIDFGATALAALKRLGRIPDELEGVAVTHLHGDHIGGLPFLLIELMFNAVRTRPLSFVGPVGTQAATVSGLREAYRDLADFAKPYPVEVQELAPGEEGSLAGATVRAFAADHMDPPDQPLCLQVRTSGGTTIAFSGDSTMSDGLLQAADGADLLVAECSCVQPPCGRHCTWQDWLRVLPTLDVPRVLFTHLNAEVRERSADLLSQAPPGKQLQFADDGLVLDL